MPVVFNCQCARCWDCKSPETFVVQHHTFYLNNKHNVEMVTDRIPVCHNCGRPKQRTNKTYFNLQHTRFCPTHEENILPPEIKKFDWAHFLNWAEELHRIAEYNGKMFDEECER